jgi:type III secretion protein C
MEKRAVKPLHKRWQGHLATSVLALGLLTAGTAPQAGPVPWPEAAFSYYAEGQSLAKVLQEFAAGFNLTLQTSVAPDRSPMTDKVTGRFNVKNPTEFIDRLSGTYGLQWFTHAGVLHVSRSQDLVVKSVPSTSLSAGANIRQVLSSLGVLEPRFGWGELPEQGVVVISGPPAYVNLIETTLAAMPSAPGGQQVRVFRLKHAAVDDRVISYRDREITTPGVANILRNLVLGATSSAGQRTVAMPNLSAVSNAAGEMGPGASTGAGASNAPAASGASGSGRAAASAGGASAGSASALSNIAPAGRTRASIQADPRINAVIVQDSPERMPMYEQLIAQLDVATPLIEIEALIIDVNTSKLDELGINWGATARNRSIAAGFGNVTDQVGANTLSIVGSARGTGVTPTTMVVSGADYLVARLRLLEQQGDAAIQARPSILTTENLGAVIDLSETQYIQTTSERTALVTPITAGTTLRVTPRVVQDGKEVGIRLSVDIEDGQIQAGSGVGAMPSVRRGTVSTEASVKGDETLLIGGYNSVQTVKGVDKVPLLGDIPFVRGFFSSRSDSVQRRERLFLIRSSLASNSSPMAVRAIPPNPIEGAKPAPPVSKP